MAMGQIEGKPGTASITLWALVRVWASIGVQSFGGGPSTSLLIQNSFVEKTHWLSDEEYIRYWALCGMVPGVNLIALSILIGKKLGGRAGIAVSLAGFLLPSASISVLITAGFSGIQDLPLVQAILRGVIPATAGLMLLVAVRTSRPLVSIARKENLLSLGFSSVLALACAFMIILFKVQIFAILFGAGVLSALFFPRFVPRNASPTTILEAEQEAE
jgi:chromate transporter